MKFNFKEFKNTLKEKYVGKLSVEEIEELLTFESGMLQDKFPQKRITVSRVLFRGTKKVGGEGTEFTFDKPFGPGVWMVLADNLRGKSSLFKIIKFGLTGEHGELAVDVRGWLKHLYVEFKINDRTFTAFADRSGRVLNASLYTLPIVEIVDKSVDVNQLVFRVETEATFKSRMEEFFFKELEFYHLQWTQKSSQKDKNELLDANATWNTYFESIYLTSRSSDKLAFGNQEELIFQMLLGLSLTFPINRIKTRLDRAQFDLAKLIEFDTTQSKARAVELKKVQKELDAANKELTALYRKEGEDLDISQLYERRSEMSTTLNSLVEAQQELEQKIFSNRGTIHQLGNNNNDLTVEGNRYKDLIQKATRSRIGLEEHISFGIFFSNLDIKICPHCNTPVSKENNGDPQSKHCYVCTHEVQSKPDVDISQFQQKIDSLNAEIAGYERQVDALRTRYKTNRDQAKLMRDSNQEHEQSLRTVKQQNKEAVQELKVVDASIRKAKERDGAAQKEIELQRRIAVLQYRMESAAGRKEDPTSDEITRQKIKVELLQDAWEQLKQKRKTQNEDILNSFKTLLLAELQLLGISNVTEIRLSESFKSSYKINDNWVEFEKISEGEQIRVKIAFYLSIIQLDTLHQAGKHPRLLIIDSPVKEEGDRNYVAGLKKLLDEIVKKYADDLQIIIGTASRELEGAVPKQNAYIYSENEYLF